MRFRLRISRDLIRAMLGGHSVIALTAAGLLYLVCVTGTFSVFYPDYERWEQPDAPDTIALDSRSLDLAIAEALAREKKSPDRVVVTLPARDAPSCTVTAGKTSAFVLGDGSLGPAVEHNWTHFIAELHYALTIPGSFGLTLVGILGVMLTALIVSGLLSHPNIFRDAFSFRMGGAERLRQVDLHNRLSVWTAPFQLVIALTGAFIALSQLFVLVTATLLFNGDTQALRKPFRDAGPSPSGVAAPLVRAGAILDAFTREHPDLQPFSLAILSPARTAQTVEIRALVPRRLVWAETYRYDERGGQIGRSRWSDGDVGVQVYASTYRLHFGHFAGLPMKIAYLLLGLALCVGIASGVNIWLIRRGEKGRPAPRIERIWIATVWGVPLAIAASALSEMSVGLNPVAVFWGLTLTVLAWAAVRKDKLALSLRLRLGIAAISALIVLVHVVKFGGSAFSSATLWVNALWLVLAIATLLSLRMPGLQLAKNGGLLTR